MKKTTIILSTLVLTNAIAQRNFERYTDYTGVRTNAFSRALLSTAVDSISKYRRKAFDAHAKSSGDFKVPERPLYSQETFDKLNNIKVSARDRASVNSGTFIANSIDYVINPAVSAVSVFGGPVGVGVGLTITTPLDFIASEVNAKNSEIDAKQHEYVNNFFASALRHNGDLTRDLYNIASEDNIDIRNENIDKFISDVRELHLKKHHDNDLGGDFDPTKEEVALNKMMTSFVTREVMNNKQLIAQTEDEFNQKLDNHLTKIQTNENNIDVNSKKIYLLGKALHETQVKQTEAFNFLAKQQTIYAENMTASINALDGKVSSLMMHEFSQMTPAQKISALKEGGLLDGHISKEAAKDLNDKWKKAASMEEFANNARIAVNVAKAFSQVGRRIGLDEDFLKVVDDAANIAGPLINLAVGLTPPYNPMAIMNGLSGLFGGGESPEASRHKQIMSALSALLEGQQKILKNQAIMQEKLDEIKAGQIEIFKQLAGINQRLLSIEKQLYSINKEILTNREYLRAILSLDFNSCNTIYSSLNTHKEITKSYEVCVENHGSVEACGDLPNRFEYIFNRSNGFLDCVKAYNDTYSITTDAVLSQVFQKTFAPLKETSSIKIYEEMYELTRKAWAGKEHQAFHALISPLKDLTKVEDRNDYYRNNHFIKLSNFDRYLKEKIDIDLLAESYRVFEEIAPFLALYHPVQSQLYPNQNDGNDHLIDTSKGQITNITENIYKASYIPLAQENLLSGSIILDYVYENRLTNFPKKAIVNNPLFAKNYILYFTNKKLIETSQRPSSLLMRMLLKDQKRLDDFFKDFGGNANVNIASKGDRLNIIGKKLKTIKVDLVNFLNYVDAVFSNYDGDIYEGREIDINKSKIKEFVNNFINENKKLQTKLNDYIKDDSEERLATLLSLIEQSKVRNQLNQYYAHPHDPKPKRNLVGRLKNLGDRYLKNLEVLYMSSQKNEQVWLELDGKEISIPSPDQIRDLEIVRDMNFYTALDYNAALKNEYTSYVLQKNALGDKELSDLVFENFY